MVNIYDLRSKIADINTYSNTGGLNSEIAISQPGNNSVSVNWSSSVNNVILPKD